jgi:RimJ/RimL family protein N-acetyltransferase
LDRPELSVDVVIGGSNPKRRAIEAACAGMPNTALHVQVEDMARRMGDANLFVGAGGTASWERCCVGLPALVMATADNQLEQCQALARAGAHLYLGAADTVSEARLTRGLECALEMPDSLVHLGERGMSLVDGRGADRVAHHLLAVTVSLRRAVAADSAALFEWRNDPETRRYALSSKPIPRESHERWLAEVLKDSRRDLLIAESGGRPLGVLRYDIDGERALVSVYLVPGLAGRGWGRRILLAGEAWLREQRPEVRRCEAEIKADNAASRASFEAIGFRPKRTLFGKDIDGRQ